MTSYTIQPIYFSGSLSGAAFRQDLKASEITTTINNIAEVLQAVDGTSTYMHRAYKRVWSVSWTNIVYSGAAGYPLATVMNLRGIYESFGSTLTSIKLGFEGYEYDVFFEPNSWQSGLTANTVSLTNKPYYTVSFRVIEK
jgi:hypothetical protein